MSLIVGVAAESAPGERRVAIVPGAVSVLNKTGVQWVRDGSRKFLARSNKSSPIYGMPILDVDKARLVMVIKLEKTLMLFGDGKEFVTEILKELPALAASAR